VARSALEALGEGLQPGTSRTVTGDPGTLAAVRGPLGGLVAAQVQEVVAVLGPVAAGTLPDPAADASLRGLARLFLQPGQQDVVTGALAGALRAGALPAVRAAEVAGGVVAVEEYGHRVRHALLAAQGLADAVERQVTFDVLVRMPAFLPIEALERVSPLGAAVADAAVDAVAVVADAEGESTPPADLGVVRTADDAAGFAAASGPGAGGGAAGAAALDAAARTGFARTTAVLGVPPIAAESVSLMDRVEPPEGREERSGHRSRGGR
jgi:predicted membrane protein